jgi:hypothetical protein
VTARRFVDADGNRIPNQTILFKSVEHNVPIVGEYKTNESVRTDSTGAFAKVTTVSAEPFVKTVDVEGWIEYPGNDLCNPTSTRYSTLTIHFTSPPAS